MCFSNIIILHSVYSMNHLKYFEDFFNLISNYRKIVLLKFLKKNDVDFLTKCEFLKKGIYHFS